jgi:N-acetylmuramoyl-L-alanine amidase
MVGRLGHRVIATLLFVGLILVGVNGRAATRRDAAEVKLERATQEWKSLNGDPRKRQYRDRWEQVITNLEAIGRSKASIEVRSEALHLAGRATEDLYRVSRLSVDLKRAEELYRESLRLKPAVPKVAQSAPVAKKEPEPKVTKAPKIVPTEETEPEQLATATQAWRRLQRDTERRTSRDAWLEVIHRLELVGDELAPERAGALGYFRAARAAEALYKHSKLTEDAKRTVELFERVSERCPTTFLNDDSLIAAAEFEWTLLQDADAARTHLARAIDLTGDSTADAQALLDRLLPLTASNSAEVAVAEVKKPEAPPSEVARREEPKKVTAAATPELMRIRQALLSDPELSLADEVGLKVRRIVIDAGHGGKDIGATGPTGILEKDVTLAIAKKLEASLTSRGYEVVLTRTGDEYLSLEERAERANQERGDLFISVHANAHPSRQQSGIETYSLNVASNRFAKRLAARENATSNRTISDTQYLLVDLATRTNTIDSDRLASRIQSSLIDGVAKKYSRPKDHGVKHALFYVLLGARMPAVLVETAFLSNPTEEKRLASPAYQGVIAESIAKGVDQFVARRRQLAAADL